MEMQEQSEQKSAQEKRLSDIVNSNYEQLGEVKVSFKLLHDFIKELNKLQLVLPASTKLLDVKKKVDEISKRNFLFYLKDSFMPSLDSKVGDLAQCYGRYDQKQGGQKLYEITFAVSSIKDEYG